MNTVLVEMHGFGVLLEMTQEDADRYHSALARVAAEQALLYEQMRGTRRSDMLGLWLRGVSAALVLAGFVGTARWVLG